MNKIIISILVSFCFTFTLQASTLEELIVSGNTFWSQGKLAEAEADFKKALEIEPDSSVVHARIANLYLTQNKTSEAIESFQDAISNDPENAQLFIGIAIAYLHKQYYEMADAMVKQAVTLDPDMKNAQKLQTYIDARQEQIRLAGETRTESRPATHASPHAQSDK